LQPKYWRDITVYSRKDFDGRLIGIGTQN
jgi:hypothetical protein